MRLLSLVYHQIANSLRELQGADDANDSDSGPNTRSFWRCSEMDAAALKADTRPSFSPRSACGSIALPALTGKTKFGRLVAPDGTKSTSDSEDDVETMLNLLQTVRYSLRKLYRSPGISLTVLLTLAVGIGANSAIFTVIYGTLLAPMAYPNPNQLVLVWSTAGSSRDFASPGDFLDWKQQNKSFQDLNAWQGGRFNIATREQPESVFGQRITVGYFRMMGAPIYLGRDFAEEDGHAGKDHVVILTHRLWEKLGADKHILSTTMRIDGEPYTVIGVLAPGITDRDPAQFSMPLVFKPEEINHDLRWVGVEGRLKPGVGLKQSQAEMDAIAARLAKAYPKSNEGRAASVEALQNDFLPNDTRLTLWLLLGSVGFVLLIACVNVANLLLARSMARQKEMAVRISLGAAPKVIFTQLLTENLLLAALGGLLGIGVGFGMLRALIEVMPPFTLPSEADLRMNLPVLLFTLAVTTLAGLLFGFAPAWFSSHANPAETLKEGGRSGTSLSGRRLQRMLVVSEFSLTLALLAGAGLAIHSFLNLERVDLGIRTDHVLTFYLTTPASRPKDPDQIAAYYRRMLASIESVPGVSKASVSSGLPLEGTGFESPFTIAGKPEMSDPAQRPSATFGLATPGYFETYGIRFLEGRPFTEQDGFTSVRVAVVNEAFVKKYLEGNDPLRHRVIVPQMMLPGATKPGPPVEWQIVGVFHNVRYRRFRNDFPEVELPFWQSPWPNAGIGIRTAGDPARMTRSIAAAVHAIDPQIALATPRTAEEVRDEMLANDRFTLILFASFAVIALSLASMGIYGVMAFAVAQRNHEMAVRMALGADRFRLVALIVKEGMVLAIVGLGFGLVGAYVVDRLMRSALFGVGGIDISTFGIAGLVLLVAAVVACYFPARRAASIEPMEILRAE
jgi:putative ABC transport system permease protein